MTTVRADAAPRTSVGAAVGGVCIGDAVGSQGGSSGGWVCSGCVGLSVGLRVGWDVGSCQPAQNTGQLLTSRLRRVGGGSHLGRREGRACRGLVGGRRGGLLWAPESRVSDENRRGAIQSVRDVPG
jgi:hypothetical protein